MDNKRYERLKDIEIRCFQLNTPVEIIKGALLLDNQLNSIILQLKLHNISIHRITAVFISVESYDSANDILGIEIVEHSYIDLDIKPKETFGDKNPIILDKTVRNVKVKITKVVLFPDTVWRNEEDNYFENPKQARIELNDNLLAFLKHKAINEGYDFKKMEFFPIDYSYVWVCSCGRPNSNNSDECIRCGVSKKFIFTNTDEENLQQDYEKYLKDIAIKEEQKKLADTNRAIKNRSMSIRALKITVIVLVGFLVLSIGIRKVYSNIQVDNNYKEFVKQYELGKFDFEESKKLLMQNANNEKQRDNLKEMMYLEAKDKLEDKEFTSVVDILTEISDYKDSKSILKSMNIYEQATLQRENNNFTNAIELFTNIVDFSDSKDQIESTIFEQAKFLYKKKHYTEAKALFEQVHNDEAEDYLNSIYYVIEGVWIDIVNKSEVEIQLLFGTNVNIKINDKISKFNWKVDDPSINNVLWNRSDYFQIKFISADKSYMEIIYSNNNSAYTYKLRKKE